MKPTELQVKVSADTRDFMDSLHRLTTALQSPSEPLVHAIRYDPSIVLFWLACVLIPVVIGLAR